MTDIKNDWTDLIPKTARLLDVLSDLVCGMSNPFVKAKVEKKVIDMTEPVGFKYFWDAYPARRGIKSGKAEARKSWNKIKPSKELIDTILRALEKAKESEQWQDENGKFAPTAVTWLNQRRWEDETLDRFSFVREAAAKGGKAQHDDKGLFEA